MLKFSLDNADVFISDRSSLESALTRTTHLGIGAHQDDLEIMAFHGISTCFRSKTKWFTGITCGDGGGSPRSGRYAKIDDSQMRELRKKEQRAAARRGNYSAMIQLGFSSASIRNRNRDLARDLRTIITSANPRVVYTHNLFDRHDTHVAVAEHVIKVIRSLPPSQRPTNVIGCEVWRSLDWLPEKYKIRMDVSGEDALARKLLEVYRTQNQGGKRYDLATLGRRRANATFDQARKVDRSTDLVFGVDLSPLVNRPISIRNYMNHILRDYRDELVVLNLR